MADSNQVSYERDIHQPLVPLLEADQSQVTDYLACYIVRVAHC